jgi:hypothetical protein
LVFELKKERLVLLGSNLLDRLGSAQLVLAWLRRLAIGSAGWLGFEGRLSPVHFVSLSLSLSLSDKVGPRVSLLYSPTTRHDTFYDHLIMLQVGVVLSCYRICDVFMMKEASSQKVHVSAPSMMKHLKNVINLVTNISSSQTTKTIQIVIISNRKGHKLFVCGVAMWLLTWQMNFQEFCDDLVRH